MLIISLQTSSSYRNQSIPSESSANSLLKHEVVLYKCSWVFIILRHSLLQLSELPRPPTMPLLPYKDTKEAPQRLRVWCVCILPRDSYHENQQTNTASDLWGDSWPEPAQASDLLGIGSSGSYKSTVVATLHIRCITKNTSPPKSFLYVAM